MASARRWRKFIALASYQGPVPAGFAERPAPDPADLGLPAEDDGSRNDPLAGQNMPSCPRYRHDLGALRAASARVVVAVGAESSAMMAGQAAVAVAGRLGTAPVTFPGGHDGFPGGEYGSTGKPDAFAGARRALCAGAGGDGLWRSARQEAPGPRGGLADALLHGAM